MPSLYVGRRGDHYTHARWSAIAVALAAFCTTVPLRAEPMPSDCQRDPACLALKDQAAELSRSGNLSEALRLYQLAYQMRPDPRLLYNIARVLHKQGQPDKATSYYQKFLDSGIAEPEQRQKAREYLEQIQPDPAALGPKPAHPVQAGEPTGGQPAVDLAKKHFIDGARLFEAGKYDLARIEFEAAFAITKNPELLHNLAITVEKQGAIFDAIQYEDEWLRAMRAELSSQEVQQAEQRLARWRAQIEPKKAAAPDGPRSAVPRGAIGLMGGGAALVLIGAALGGTALAERNRLYEGVYASEVDALLDRNRAFNAATISLCVIGGVAVATGGAWAIADAVHKKRAAPKTLALSEPSVLVHP